MGDPSLHRRARHSPLRGAGVSGLAQLATLALSPGVPRSWASPWLPVHLAAPLLTETSFCRRQNLPCRPGRPSRGNPPLPPPLPSSTSEENLLPLGANGPCTPMGSRRRPSGTRPTCRHAGKGGKTSGLPGLPLHTHKHPCPLNGFFFFFPFPLLHHTPTPDALFHQRFCLLLAGE